MADIIHLAIHLLWAAVAAYTVAQCRAWLVGRVDGNELASTKKTVEWLKSELEKLRAVPKMPPRF